MSINENQKEIEELDEEKETTKGEEEKCEDCKKCKTKKGSMGLVTVLIIALLVASAIGGWIVGTSGMINTLEEKINKVSEKKQETKEDTKEETTEVEEVEQNEELGKTEETTTKSNSSNSNTPRCTGTYYGKYYSKDNQGITTDMEYTYVLNDDGTYTANLSDIHKLQGEFIITENTATFIQLKDTHGDPKESTIYTSVDYVIADDCSYMLTDDGRNLKLDRQ